MKMQSRKTTEKAQVTKDSILDSSVAGDNFDLFSAHIESFLGNYYLMMLGDKKIKAKLADSCFLKPDVGDQVLLSSSNRGESYILSVLHRNSKNESEVNIKADIINVNGKNISLKAKENIEFFSKKAHFLFKTSEWVSDLWQGFFGRFFRHSGHAYKVSNFTSETASSYVLHVDGLMQQKAQSVDIEADNHFNISSKQNGVIQTKENLVIPSKQTSFT